MSQSSRLPGFYRQSVPQRLTALAAVTALSDQEQAILEGTAGLQTHTADHMIENVVGIHGLPLPAGADGH